MSGSHPTNTPVSSGTGYTSEISPGAMGIRLRSPAAHPFSLGTAPESLPDLGPPCAPVLLTSGAVTCRPLPGHLAHRLVDFLGHGLCFFSLFTLSRSVAEHSGGQATMTNQCHHIHTSRSSPRLPDSISPGGNRAGERMWRDRCQVPSVYQIPTERAHKVGEAQCNWPHMEREPRHSRAGGMLGCLSLSTVSYGTPISFRRWESIVSK